MRGLGCQGCGLGYAPVTVTAGCPTSYTDISDPNNPHTVYVSQIQHDLCVARQAVRNGAAGAGAGAWNAINSFNSELHNILNVFRASLGPYLSQLLQDLANRVRAFLNSLLGAGSFWLLLIIGGAIVLASGVHEESGKAA